MIFNLKRHNYIIYERSKNKLLSIKKKRHKNIKHKKLRKSKNEKTNSSKSSFFQFILTDQHKNNSKQLINYKEKNNKKKHLQIDFSFKHLINIDDENIDELNEVPYTQALRIDKRNIIQMFFSVVVHKIGFLNLLCNVNPYSLLSIEVSIYLFELLLGLTMIYFLFRRCSI